MFGLTLALLIAAAPARGAAIDLHAHLLMDEALPGLFHGRPTGAPIAARGRRDNQVSLADLEAANVRLVGVALYAAPAISLARGGAHRELLRQLAAAERWAAADPRLTIVRSPAEAEEVLRSKTWRLGLILSAEGGDGADTPARLDALWERGLRLLTIAHFSDTRWGGAADVRYWPRPTCVPGGEDSGRRSPRGLSPEGEKLVDWAVSRGLLLDFTHASDRTVLDAARRHPELPLLFTHQAFRGLAPCERAISSELLAEVRRSDGLVGLTFAANYVGPDRDSLLRHAWALAEGAGPEAVVLGTDFNGLADRVAGAEDSSAYGPVLETLEQGGVAARRGAEVFVAFWRRSQNAGRPGR